MIPTQSSTMHRYRFAYHNILLGIAGLSLLFPVASCTADSSTPAQVQDTSAVTQDQAPTFQSQVTVDGKLLSSLPDGRFFTNGTDGATYIWDPNGNELMRFKGSLLTGTFFKIRAGGKLATADEADVYVWTLEGEDLTPVLRDRPDDFTGFTPRQDYLMFYDEASDTTTLVDDEGTEQGRFSGLISGISGDETLWIARKPVPDGFGYTYRLLDAEGSLLTEFEAEDHAFLPDEQRLLTYSYGPEGIGRGGATAQLWNTSGQRIADFAGEVKFLDVFTNEQLSFYRPMENTMVLMSTEGEQLDRFDGFLLEMSPDGKAVTQVEDENFVSSVVLWEPGAPFPVRLDQEKFAELAPTGEVVTYQSGNGVQGLRLWRFDGTKIATLETDSTLSMLTPDGQYIVSGSEETILWDLTGQEIARFVGEAQGFTEDGRLITYSWDERKTHVWRLDQF